MSDTKEIRGDACQGGAEEAYGWPQDTWDGWRIVTVMSKTKPRSGDYWEIGPCRNHGTDCEVACWRWPGEDEWEEDAPYHSYLVGYRYGWLMLERKR